MTHSCPCKRKFSLRLSVCFDEVPYAFRLGHVESPGHNSTPSKLSWFCWSAKVKAIQRLQHRIDDGASGMCMKLKRVFGSIGFWCYTR